MINGGICGYSGGDLVSYTADAGSQLDAAVAFLAAHRGHVPLITIDIGANDVLTCLGAGTPDNINACVQQELPIIAQQLTRIMAKLTAADPRATIVGMTYADPAVAAWLGGPPGQAFAIQSIAVDSAFRHVLIGVYRAAGARIADSVLGIRDSRHDGPDHPSGVGPYRKASAWSASGHGSAPRCHRVKNIHPNTTGYGVIARTFLAALGDRDR